MKHSFNKRASSYVTHCDIQSEVARKLVEFIDFSDIKSILDLGAGSGNIAKNLNSPILNFLALDSSQNMLSLHPKKLNNIAKIELLYKSFEEYSFSEKFDLVISSSALHWARDIEAILKKIVDSRSFKYLAFSFFTSNSLYNIHSFLGSKSPLLSHYELESIFNKYISFSSKILAFKKSFDTPREYLLYLKHSGLLGGGELSYRDKKRLRFEFDRLEAEFEVVLIKSDLRRLR